MAATTLTVVALLPACGSASEEDASDPAARPAVGVASNDGIRRVAVPLSSRHGALVLPMGDRVLVFGGYHFERGRDRPVRPLGNGAVYDATTDTWAKTPPLPLPAPLLHAAGVWTGEEAVLLGTPCEAAGGDEGLDGCRPGGAAAVAYSPTRGTWRVVEGVRAPEGFEAETGNAIESTGLGWTGSHAAFSVSAGGATGSILLLDLARGAARWASGAPGADASCAVGGRLLAVETGQVDASGGVVFPNPVAASQPLRTLALDPAIAEWKPLSTIEKPASTGASFDRAVCQGGQLVYLPVRPPPEGFGSGGLWWNTDRSAWDPIPALGSVGYPGEPRVADVSGTRIIWFIGGIVGTLRPGADAWTVRPVPTRLPVRIAGVAGRLLVDTTTSERDGPLTLGFIDVAQLEQAVREPSVSPGG